MRRTGRRVFGSVELEHQQRSPKLGNTHSVSGVEEPSEDCSDGKNKHHKGGEQPEECRDHHGHCCQCTDNLDNQDAARLVSSETAIGTMTLLRRKRLTFSQL